MISREDYDNNKLSTSCERWKERTERVIDRLKKLKKFFNNNPNSAFRRMDIQKEVNANSATLSNDLRELKELGFIESKSATCTLSYYILNKQFSEDKENEK